MSIPQELWVFTNPFDLFPVEVLVSLLEPEDYSVLYELVEYGKDSRKIPSKGVLNTQIMESSSKLKQKEFTQKALEQVYCSHHLPNSQEVFDEVWKNYPNFSEVIAKYGRTLSKQYPNSTTEDRMKEVGLLDDIDE